LCLLIAACKPGSEAPPPTSPERTGGSGGSGAGGRGGTTVGSSGGTGGSATSGSGGSSAAGSGGSAGTGSGGTGGGGSGGSGTGGSGGSAGTGGSAGSGGGGTGGSAGADAAPTKDAPGASDGRAEAGEMESAHLPGRPDLKICKKEWTPEQCCAFLCSCLVNICSDSPKGKPGIATCMNWCPKLGDMARRCHVYHCYVSISPTGGIKDHDSHCGHAADQVAGGGCPMEVYK
jgi:hypothetical protein